MINCYLKTIETATKLTNICNQFTEDIDVIYSRQVVDGKSYLGVVSLVGNYVSVSMNTNDVAHSNELKEKVAQLDEEA